MVRRAGAARISHGEGPAPWSPPKGSPGSPRAAAAVALVQDRLLLCAFVYNALGIPLAAGVLFGAGILLPPALAAVFMSASTIIVAANAQLLRLLKLRNT